MHGYGVDFLDFYWARHHFPAFNVAEMGITLGAALLIWTSCCAAASLHRPQPEAPVRRHGTPRRNL